MERLQPVISKKALLESLTSMKEVGQLRPFTTNDKDFFEGLPSEEIPREQAESFIDTLRVDPEKLRWSLSLPSPKRIATGTLEATLGLSTDLSSVWHQERERRKGLKIERLLTSAKERRENLNTLKEIFEGEFTEALGEELPRRDTPEYDREFLLYVRQKLAEMKMIDSIGKASEKVGQYLADLKEERGKANVEVKELDPLIKALEAVLPLRLKRNFQDAREFTGTKVAKLAGGVSGFAEGSTYLLAHVMKATLPLSSGAGLGAGFALARGIISWETVKIYSGVGALLSLICYGAFLKWRESRGPVKSEIEVRK